MGRSIRLRIRIFFTAVAIIGFFAGHLNAASSFPSKNITFIVPTSPGGGFDIFARLLIPYIKKYLPNPVNIVVNNSPGGEWNIGVTKMFRAKPDGYTIGVLNLPGNAVNQMLGTGKYDLRKITWLGNMSQVAYASAASIKSNYKSIEDLQKAAEVNASVVSLSGTGGLITLISADKMKIKIKPISHEGSTEAILSVMRGDLDWYQGPFASLKKSIVDANDLVPLWVYTRKRLELLPDVPTIIELGYENLLDLAVMYRAVGAPPGVPADVVKILQEAFWRASNDVEYQRRVIAANEQPDPMKAEEIASVANNALLELIQYKELVLKYRK